MAFQSNNEQGYTNVAIADDVEDRQSVTEVDASLLEEDEKRWRLLEEKRGNAPQSKTSRFMALFRRFRWLIDTVLLLVNITLSVMLLRGFRLENSGPSMQVGGDFNGAGPEFPTKIIKFDADLEFVPTNASEFFSDAVLAKWNTMMPAGTGWGEVTEDTFFTTSMTHQLHCVFMMGRIYSALAGNMSDKLMSDYNTHYLHCIDYLRQAIMCSADLTMEPHRQTDADDNGPGDGSWNGYHVCKDYSHVTPYLEEQIAEGIRKVLPIDD